jgi:hypothetical protein
MHDCYIFIGPTISQCEAMHWLDATYLPPVSQGDIAGLLRRRPRVIGIIDGYFERVPAVWHKEILLALSAGIHVVGGASMGALRAAELYPFGMVGVGEIFAWYRDGRIDADDEVAVRHAPASFNYRPLSEAMVNIRKTLENAQNDMVISQATMETLLAIGVRLPYAQRSYACILDRGCEAGLHPNEIESLKCYLRDHKVDQKKRDAIDLLTYIANLDVRCGPRPAGFTLQYTDMLDGLIDKDSCIDRFDDVHITVDMIVNQARLEDSNFVELADRARCSKELLQVATRSNTSVTRAEYRERIDYIKNRFCNGDRYELLPWLQRNHLSLPEFRDFATQWALIEKMRPANHVQSPHDRLEDVNSLFLPDNHGIPAFTYGLSTHIIRQLRIEGTYESIVDTLLAKEKMINERPIPNDYLSDEEQIYIYYFQHKGIPRPRSVIRWANERGFSNIDIFKLEIMKYCYYLQQRAHITG